MAILTILEMGRRTVLETVEEIKELIDNSDETNDYIKVNISSLKKDVSDRTQYETAYIFKYHLTMFE